MRVARAFRVSVVTALLVLSVAGCTQHGNSLARRPAPDSLDAIAYGPVRPAPLPPRGLFTSGFASGAAGPRSAYAATPLPAPVMHDPSYLLDSGDRLRVLVYGQEGLTNTYAIDASGAVTMPLIGAVPARGRTPAGLAAEIAARLRAGFIREPSVAVEIESYRPFFILGEVAAPGQYPYVPNLSVESAVAIAGGFSPRAKRDEVMLTRSDARGILRIPVPLGTPVRPGDTLLVCARCF